FNPTAQAAFRNQVGSNRIDGMRTVEALRRQGPKHACARALLIAAAGGQSGPPTDDEEPSIGMSTDPDPFEQGERAARENIPAEANPYQDGSEQHALWASGHERVASAREANESEGT
ncbi:hypothetical protein, partial [Bradyrhizobium sp.]